MSGDFASSDTIAAIATPLGIGGIGIVRVSGPSSLSIAKKLFTSTRPDFTEFKPHRLHHGVFSDAHQAPLDEVLAAYMPGPHSYTGEDVVEIHCHGGPAVVGLVLEAILDCGARTANPGEFTLRAYLNGRMDLTQAEAVAEMIAAPTKAGLTLARAKLDGSLGRKITGLRNTLEDLRAKLCVAVDFPDDEVEVLSPQEFMEGVDQVLTQVAGLVQNFEQNKCWSQGVLAVLAGQVNAGKSSLLNALLGRNRALVADAPGTTRDYLEESLNLDGLLVRLTDTAGLRETKDAIELAGVEKSKDLTAQADLVLLVIDQAVPLSDTDLRFAKDLGAKKTLTVLNKSDLAPANPNPEVALHAAGFETINISAKTGAKLEDLTRRVRARILERKGASKQGPDAATPVPNLRQSQALRKAHQELNALKQDIHNHIPYDLLGVRLETACAILSEITGEISPQHVLDEVFGRFCIGK